jgi:hypothetical protein
MADEFSIVRAIGNQPADRTMDIVREVSARHPEINLVTGEYFNEPEHADWTHVDNFGAARQMSFDLASNDWAFWCDSDDILERGAERIREHADKGDFICYMFPYKIFGRGMSVPRERLVKKSHCKWVHRVHECLEFNPAPAKALQDEYVCIQHLPKTDRLGSHPRNLKILRSIPEAEMTTGLLFHMNEELIIAEELDEAVEVAKKTLKRPDLGRPEKMELFLNLAHAAKAPEHVESLLIQAYAADPRRREPLCNLTNHMLNYNQPEFAMAFCRQMLSIAEPPPNKIPWNHRAPMYGWLGEELYSQCLRMLGFYKEGDAVNAAALIKCGGPTIALIHATRGRAKQAATTRKVWMDLAARPEMIDYLLVFDDDDEDSKLLRRFRHQVVPAGGGCVAAWNMGLFNTTAQVVVQMSDDWTPPQKWDDMILERIGDPLQKRVLAVSDGTRTDQLLCMGIATRKYLEQDCYFFHPGFKSMFSDNWFTHQAYQRGAVIEARDLVFVHRHPVFGTAPADATYLAQNAPDRYRDGEALFNRLMAGRDWANVPGFFDYFSFYDYIADKLKDGDTVAEVGVWLGRSLIYLAQRLQSLGKKVNLLAVDHFKGEPGIPEHQSVVSAHGGSIRAEFEANLNRCGVRDMVTICDGDSVDQAATVADGFLDFVFIDAAHDYNSIKQDLAAWSTKIKPDGIIAGHDAQWWEVEKAVKEKFPNAVISGSLWTVNLK